jgi:hypothetical protein
VGTWDASILGNDTAAQAYERFFELFDAGEGVEAAAKTVASEMRTELAMREEGHHVHLALSLARWECGALDARRLEAVRRLVGPDGRRDLRAYATLEAKAAFLKKRAAALRAFLKKIAARNPKPRKAKPAPATTSSPFVPGCCFAVEHEGRYRAFWIASAATKRTWGDLGITCLDLDAAKVPTLARCERAFVRGMQKEARDDPPRTWRGERLLVSYDLPDRRRLFAALAERCVLVGRTAPPTSKRLLWSSMGGGGGAIVEGDALARRLFGLHETAKELRWARRHRLSEVVAALAT